MPRRTRLLLLLMLAAGVAILITAGRVLLAGPTDFPRNTEGQPVAIHVSNGQSLTEIGRTLSAAGVIASTESFIEATKANPKSIGIGAGDYQIPAHIPAATAITYLLDPAYKDQLRITLKEGWRAERSLAEIEKVTGLPAGQVQAAFQAQGLPYAATGIEGFLFPATYAVNRTVTADQIAAMILDRFKKAMRDLDMDKRAAAIGLTPMQVLTMASIEEVESMPQDYAKVSRVILNRIAKGMPLQMDSTVNYGLRTATLKLTNKDLRVDTAYNTYLHTGLPPTPIGNPGEEAINAALSPESGPWLYFVTTNVQTGYTEFAETYKEFLTLKEKYLASQR